MRQPGPIPDSPWKNPRLALGESPTRGLRFERIERIAQIERAREIITKYHEGIRYYQQQIEDNRYSLGRLDERLGG